MVYNLKIQINVLSLSAKLFDNEIEDLNGVARSFRWKGSTEPYTHRIPKKVYPNWEIIYFDLRVKNIFFNFYPTTTLKVKTLNIQIKMHENIKNIK